jgi:hypothetical protein
MTRGKDGEPYLCDLIKAYVWERRHDVANTSKKIPVFLYDDKDGVHTYTFPEASIPDVRITIEQPAYDRFGRLMATVTAHMGAVEANVTNLDLLNQQRRVDFESVTAQLDGAVPWNVYLQVIVPHLQRWLKAQSDMNTDRPRPSWDIFSLADAYLPREPTVELVKGLLPLPSLEIMYGGPGTLKSFLLLDLAMCVAAGQKVRGWLCPLDDSQGFPRMIQQASALWVDFDNGPRRMHERAAAIGRASDLSPDVPFHYVSMPTPWLDASKPLGLDPLRAAIEQFEAKIIIIDNLLLIKGGLEENSADMGIVMAHLRQLTEEYQCVVVPIHHQRKDQGGRAGDRLRGHSSIEAAIDLALLVEREDGSDTITIRSTKTRDIDVPPFAAMLAYEHQPSTTALSKARFFGMPQADEHSDRAIEQTIREVLTGVPLLKTELCAMVHGRVPKVGINRIRGVVERMIAQHHIHMSPGNRGSQWLSKRP